MKQFEFMQVEIGIDASPTKLAKVFRYDHIVWVLAPYGEQGWQCCGIVENYAILQREIVIPEQRFNL